MRPYIVEHARLGSAVRVQAVYLHQLRISADSFKQKGHQGNPIAPRQVAVDIEELFDVDLTIVRRQAYADKQHRRTLFLTLLDNGAEIVTHFGERQGAQTVVAT